MEEAQSARTGPGLRFFVALVHHPVYNRKREVVATAITNLDVHDIARACHAYGADGFLVVNPLERQRWLLERILRHWKTGHGAEVHPNRRAALERVYPMWTLDEAVGWVEGECGHRPLTIATSARSWPRSLDYLEMKETLRNSQIPSLLVLGTGWGLSDEVIAEAGYILRPILEGAPYNHLSVRSAAAIILDRLLGDR